MSQTITTKKGDTQKPWPIFIKDGNNPVDLTGKTVKIYMRSKQGGDNKIKGATADVLGSPLDGALLYWPTAADVDAAGEYKLEVKTFNADEKPATYPESGSITVVIENGLA